MSMTARRRGILNSGRGLWTPALLGDQLWLWLDADSGSNFFQTNNGNVSMWFDLSNKNNNVSQSEPTQQPALIPNFLNNQSAVKFSSSDQQWLNTSSDFLITGDPSFSVFVIFQKEIVTQGMLYGWGTSALARSAFGLFDNNQTLISYLFVGDNSVQVEPIQTQQPIIHGYTKAPGAIAETSIARKNGVNTITGVGQSFNTPAILPRPLSVGRFADFDAAYFDGYLFEMVVAQPALSSLDLLRVEGYFAHRWGVENQLPADHLFKNTPP